MSEKETIQQENENEMPADNESKKSKSLLETYREITARERTEALKRESELEAARADRERKARDDYAEKLKQEKLELLKLKQGVISEEDIPKEEKIEKQYTIWEKISNFFYHNKTYIVFGTVAALIFGFLVYDFVTTVHPDVSVMFIATDASVAFVTEDMETVLEQYCEDYNDDGVVDVRVSYLPAILDTSGGHSGLYYQQSDQTKLMAEFQAVDSIIVIADYDSCEEIGITENVLADLSSVYPDDENVSELGYMLSGTSFAEDSGYSELADNLFIGFRKPVEGFGVDTGKFQQNYDNALELWTNYLNGNVVNPVAENSEAAE